MLNIITGRTGSGKTRYIRGLAADLANTGKDKDIIIVPEQFSFETERAMLLSLGNEKINNVEIFSFSRLAERLLSEYGKISGKTADDGTRAVLMSLAIETLEGKLSVFNRYRRRPALIGDLLEFHSEMKKCRISNGELMELSTKVKKVSFQRKLSELSLIFDCYDALISKNFTDDSAYLDMLYDLLGDIDFFNGKTVFIDAFSGFSSQEYKIIERIMQVSDDVYVSFCCDTSKNNGRYELFYNAVCEIKKLKAAANRLGVKIAPEKVLYAKREFKAEPLNILEENLFSSEHSIFDEPCDCITLIPCRSKTDECDAVAAEIKRLVRTEKLRYRDIAVIERSGGTYRNELVSSFRKYGIHCFEDNRRLVETQPLMVFMTALFDILTEGFQTETVLRLLKTGLYGFSVEEIALIEDYCLVWNIRSSEWKSEWSGNPDGFGVEFTDDNKKILSQLNMLREKIVAPILSLKGKIADTDGETISRELFLFLRRVGVDKNLKSLITLLEDGNESELALEQGRIWQILTEILDGLYFSLGKMTLSVGRYSELFAITVGAKDIGEIPNGIDEVIIGSADRIRASAPKAAFIVGANTGVFPMDCGGGVLFSDSERCELIDNGADIVSNLEYNSVSEKFIAYHAMTLATDKLYISYSALGSDSSSLTPSELVDEIKRIFPNVSTSKTETAKLDRIESRKSAFATLAGEIKENSVLGASLYSYFNNNSADSAELAMLDKVGKKSFTVKDGKIAEELFGKNMYISASKTEKFYKCPFEYFCEYGIKAKPRREAELDSAQTGTLIHFVLERFLRENSKEACLKLSQSGIKEKINSIIDSYTDEKLGGYSGKSNAFLRSIQLIKSSAQKVVLHMIDELAHSSFIPVDFELSINNDGDIMPYSITLPNGGTVKIIGSVDRVDAYKTDDNTFVRVIDYKTGGKAFNLYDVFAGLNMQMLIYLFAIWQNGKERYGNVVPAGILYFQAKSPRLTRGKLSRYSGSDKIKSELQKELKMSGMILNNTSVIDAMEKDGAGVFIPAGINKSGNATGNVISLKSLEALRKKVNSAVQKMAEDLQSGMIDAFPVEKACDYCKYADICMREADGAQREIEQIDFNDAVNMLGGET
ncbi:MAG: PD-(D/E)XK nuclease family protein [Oscillospiraceae bacterium]|nr:PD-(D/E)XK nuclease family protein [Oscillospiraceae bacterium]